MNRMYHGCITDEPPFLSYSELKGVSARPESISFFQREILWTKKITFSSLFRPGENGEPPSATENPADKRLSAFSSQEPLFGDMMKRAHYIRFFSLSLFQIFKKNLTLRKFKFWNKLSKAKFDIPINMLNRNFY